MTDARALRDAIERTQVELREARARLARPVEAERITAEVTGKLEALGAERARLLEELRAIDGLRSRADEAALRLRLAASTWDVRAIFEGFVALALVAASGWTGTVVAPELPTLMGLAAIVAYPVIVFDAMRLTRWARRRVLPGGERLRLPALRGLGWAAIAVLAVAVTMPFVPDWLAAHAAARPVLRWDRSPTADTLSDADYRAQYALDAPALEEAEGLIANRDFIAARDRLHLCTDQRPSSVECHRMLGVYYGKFFETDKAAEELRLFLRYAPLTHPRYEEAAQLIEYLDARSD